MIHLLQASTVMTDFNRTWKVINILKKNRKKPSLFSKNLKKKECFINPVGIVHSLYLDFVISKKKLKTRKLSNSPKIYKSVFWF